MEHRMNNEIRFNSTLFSTPKRGIGGKSSYRGNCCPQIIEALINQYRMKYLSDYAIGGGTTKDVCERMGVNGYWTDLRFGFDLMNNEIPDCPENIFYHPAYWNMNNKIIYSNTEYSWQDVKNKYGYDPRNTDLSQAPTWELFVKMLNYTVLKQFASMERGGRMGILMGDIKTKGKLYSMLFEIAKPGTVEQVVIKEQHNCWSDKQTYSGTFIPTEHEYLLILRKDMPYMLDFQMARNVKLDIRDSEAVTWEDVESVAMELKGKQDERDMYLSNVQTAIDQANVGIKTKLTMDEFAYYTDNNMELTAIIKKISDQAAKIAEAEKPKPEPVPEPVIEPETEPVTMVEEKPEVKEQQPENDTVINPVLEKVESQYIVTFTAKASRSKMEALCKYLKENSISFKTISQQKVNN